MRDTVHVYYKDPDYMYRPDPLTEEEQNRLIDLNIGKYLHLKVDLSSGHVEVEP